MDDEPKIVDIGLGGTGRQIVTPVGEIQKAWHFAVDELDLDDLGYTDKITGIFPLGYGVLSSDGRGYGPATASTPGAWTMFKVFIEKNTGKTGEAYINFGPEGFGTVASKDGDFPTLDFHARDLELYTVPDRPQSSSFRFMSRAKRRIGRGWWGERQRHSDVARLKGSKR